MRPPHLEQSPPAHHLLPDRSRAVNNEIVVKLPHRLTQDEAIRRINAGVEKLQARYGASVAAIETRWTGNRLDGQVTVLSQSIAGSIEVEPSEVIITLRLPFLLAMLKDRILGFVQKNGEKVLQIK
jgi:putative polyhydroxyalkanoate system protein